MAPIPPSEPTAARPWRRGARRLAAGLLVAAVVAGACSSDDEQADTDTDQDFGDPGDCIVVEAAISPEKISLISDLAREFNEADNEVDGECVFVRPQRKSSGAAMQLLADGWGTDAAIEEVEGPPPAIWSPAGSTWGAILDQRRSEAGDPPMANEGTPFMLTPLVIAMPEKMATALGWPDEPIGWSDVLELSTSEEGWAAYGHPEWGPFKLGKTNPNFSTSGLAALIAQLYAASDKTADLSLEDLNDPEVVQYARDIESAVVHYGDTTLTYLNNWYGSTSPLTYTSAAAVEEKSVIDYNRGDPDGILDPGEEPRPPREPLVAIYPEEGTLYSDNPLFILDAPWVSDQQRAAAELFSTFVQEPENQQRVLEFGFRPANPDVDFTSAPDSPITAEYGVDPEQPQTLLEVPEPEVMTSVLDFWDENRKGARVLLVLDVSGSMGDRADDETGESKLELAQRAAVDSLDQFNDADQVGLRVFTTDIGESGAWVDLVPIGPMDENRRDIERAIEEQFPLNGTPLYDVTEDSFEAVVESYDPDRINAVVLLTDGRNDDGDSSDDADQLSDLLDTLTEETQSEIGRPVRVFPIAYGSDADLEVLRQIAESTNAAAYDASDPASISKVFTAVVSNF
jgi:Ca-activated chloride channel family protein